jgi:hypothetical protein
MRAGCAPDKLILNARVVADGSLLPPELPIAMTVTTS